MGLHCHCSSIFMSGGQFASSPQPKSRPQSPGTAISPNLIGAVEFHGHRINCSLLDAVASRQLQEPGRRAWRLSLLLVLSPFSTALSSPGTLRVGSRAVGMQPRWGQPLGGGRRFVHDEVKLFVTSTLQCAIALRRGMMMSEDRHTAAKGAATHQSLTQTDPFSCPPPSVPLLLCLPPSHVDRRLPPAG